MCMIDDYSDGVSVYRESWHRTRTERKCCECRRIISPGERYRYSFYVYEGRGESNHTCAQCAVVEDWLRVECHGWVFEMIDEDLAQHLTTWFSEDDEREVVRPSRPARLLVGMRRQWRRFDGAGLMAPLQ